MSKRDDPCVESYSDSESSDDSVIAPVSNVAIKTINDPDGTFPWSYYNPEAEKQNCQVTWTCGLDDKNNIVSVFSFTDARNNKDKQCSYLKDYDEAVHYKNTLIADKWLPAKPPDVQFTVSDGKGGQRPINRKEKRYVERQLRRGRDITKL